MELLLPKDAPTWLRDIQDEMLQNLASAVQKLVRVGEAAEKRIDAQVWREFEFALPRELTLSQNKDLMREFVQRNTVATPMPNLFETSSKVKPSSSRTCKTFLRKSNE